MSSFLPQTYVNMGIGTVSIRVAVCLQIRGKTQTSPFLLVDKLHLLYSRDVGRPGLKNWEVFGKFLAKVSGFTCPPEKGMKSSKVDQET